MCHYARIVEKSSDHTEDLSRAGEIKSISQSVNQEQVLEA